MEKLSSGIVYYSKHPDFITLRIKGHLTLETSDQIEKNLTSIYAVCAGKKVLFDLTDTIYVSSSGWGLFLIANKRIHDLGGRFILAGMSVDLDYTFKLLEFHNLMNHYPDVASAFREGVNEPALALPGKGLIEKKSLLRNHWF